MFTGIIEKTGKIVNIEKDRTNYNFTLEVDFAEELAIDQSMAHDGCCLTVVKLDKEKKQYVIDKKLAKEQGRQQNLQQQHQQNHF